MDEQGRIRCVFDAWWVEYVCMIVCSIERRDGDYLLQTE